jgi:hypothetical protein
MLPLGEDPYPFRVSIGMALVRADDQGKFFRKEKSKEPTLYDFNGAYLSKILNNGQHLFTLG